MAHYGLPALYALFIWWFSTGVIIYLDGLPRRTFRWSMLGATIVLSFSIYGLAIVSTDTTVAGAYAAFTYGLLAWGWQEISFYMGFVTGSRGDACAEGCSGWRHFGHAIQTSLYHELAIIISAAVVVAVSWDAPNQIGTWTFMVLWWMHQSARINVFLGVPNLNEEFLPEHMKFLKSFLTKKPMNLLFPVSVTISTVIAALLFQRAFGQDASTFTATGFTFLGTLMVLAILEHWFLVLPLPVATLWSWSLRLREIHQGSRVEAVAGSECATVESMRRAVTPRAVILPATRVAQELAFDRLPIKSVAAPLSEKPNGAYDQGGPGNAALGLKSWSARLSHPCDLEGLRSLLDAVAGGAFGHVERVKGIARAGSGWIHFDVAASG